MRNGTDIKKLLIREIERGKTNKISTTSANDGCRPVFGGQDECPADLLYEYDEIAHGVICRWQSNAAPKIFDVPLRNRIQCFAVNSCYIKKHIQN